MTPSNTPIMPQINNIADSGGNKHTVVPSNHSHSQSEVDGLTDALAAKANAIPAGSPTGAIVIANTAGEISRSGKTITDLLSAIAAKADKNELGDSESGTFVQIDNDILRLSAYQKMVLGISEPDDEFVEISNDNIQNLRRALANPDTTPKTNSNNLITSGGIKTALDKKLDVKSQGVTIIRKTAQPITPRNIDSDIAILHERHYILQNTGITEPNVSDYFSSSDMTLHYSMDAQIKVPITGWVAICVRRVQSLVADNNLYITYEGTGRLS